MRIRLVSLAKDITDKRSWSGTPYMVYNTLKKMGHSVTLMYYVPSVYPLFDRVMNKIFSFIGRLTQKRFLYWFSSLFQRSLKKEIKKCSKIDEDLIFVVGQSFLIPPLLPNDRPIVYLCDATFSAVEDYYPEFSNLFRFSSRQGNRICSKAMHSCCRIITSSHWAKKHAVTDYKIEPSSIDVVEFGGNIDCQEMGHIKKSYSNRKVYKVMFSGVHWERKGGRIAVECCDELKRMGYEIQLIVAGLEIPKLYQRDYVRAVGFLDKNDTHDYEQYISLLKEADFMLFPSKAECSSIALCEAAGFALPVFAYKTGGLDNYVKNEYNGYLLPYNSDGKVFAQKIHQAIYDGQLQRLSDNASRIYREKLNWTVWGEKVNTIIDEINA